jgi:hypothetical protein
MGLKFVEVVGIVEAMRGDVCGREKEKLGVFYFIFYVGLLEL